MQNDWTGCLNEIGMTRSLQYARHRVSAFLRQDGIGGIAGVRSIDIATAGNVHLMPHLRATFGNEQVIIAILLVNMRTFRISSSQTCAQMVYVT